LAKHEPPQRQAVLPTIPTTRFERDVKRMGKRSKSLPKMYEIIESLARNRALPSRCQDHALTGNLRGWRECHIESDWFLIYKREGGKLILGRTGSHATLFE
jgi:mRNA interferase YafQ